ncbi:hypothetical protein GW915_12770 [bacterium]|nr:hypothetical protein [bacterium]
MNTSKILSTLVLGTLSLSLTAMADRYEPVFIYCTAIVSGEKTAVDSQGNSYRYVGLIEAVKAEHVYHKGVADAKNAVVKDTEEMFSKSYSFSFKPDDQEAEKITLSVTRTDDVDPDGDTTWVKTLITDDRRSDFNIQFSRTDVAIEGVETISCGAYTD